MVSVRPSSALRVSQTRRWLRIQQRSFNAKLIGSHAATPNSQNHRNACGGAVRLSDELAVIEEPLALLETAAYTGGLSHTRYPATHCVIAK